MMQKIFKHYTCSILTFIFIVTSNAYAENDTLTNVFASNLYQYSIRYPTTWKLAEHGEGVVVFTGQDAQSKRHFTVNIQTIYTKKGGGKYKSIKDLMDDFRSQVPIHTQEAKFLDRAPFDLKETDGSTTSGEQTTLTFKENKQTYKQWQIMLTSKDGKLFQAWAYRAPIESFDANRPLAASMLASWIIN